MKALKFFGGLAVLAADVAHADVHTVSGTGSFALFSGYGFSCEATWDSGPINYNFTFSSLSDGITPLQVCTRPPVRT